MKKCAFVVGIGEQTSTGLKPLPGAVRDAEEIERLLSGVNDEVPISDPWEVALATSRLKTSFEGSLDDLTSRFDAWLHHHRNLSDERSHALVYFAGHAMLDDWGQVRLMALDGTWMAVAELTKRVLQLGAHNTTVILDCCHAGALAENVRRDMASAQTEGLTVLAACRALEQAVNYNGMGGEYTGLVLDGLGRDASVVGEVTAAGLGQYIADNWDKLPREVTEGRQPEGVPTFRARPVPLVTRPHLQRPDIAQPSHLPTSELLGNGPVVGPRGDIQVEQSGTQLRLSWVNQATGTVTAWTAPVMINPGDRALSVNSVYDRSGAFILVTSSDGTRIVRARTDGTSTARAIPDVQECASAHFGVGAELGTVTLTARDGSTQKRDLVGLVP